MPGMTFPQDAESTQQYFCPPSFWASNPFALSGTDLSMFLRFALRKATIPSFANASREKGSMPWKTKNEDYLYSVLPLRPSRYQI